MKTKNPMYNMAFTAILFLAIPEFSIANAKSRTQSKAPMKPSSQRMINPEQFQKQIEIGKNLISEKKTRAAVLYFYKMLYGKNNLTEINKNTVRFQLGTALAQSQLNQISSFNFLAVSMGSDKQLTQDAFEHLVSSAQALDDQSLLYFSLRRTEVENLNKTGKQYFYKNLAKNDLESGDPLRALENANQALALEPDNEEAIYLKALALIRQNKNNATLPLLERIYKKHEFDKGDLRKKDEATVALARVNYNLKNWPVAIELYKQISKDSHLYRNVLREQSWSYFRNSQFRSALSVLHSLHTPYYENFYDPESWVLRSIILLFICQPDDLERSINFFNKYYVTAYNSLKAWNDTGYSDARHFITFEKVIQAIEKNKKLDKVSNELPYFFFRTLSESPELTKKLSYLNKLKTEKKLLNKTFTSPEFRFFLSYGNQILDSRIKNVSLNIGQLIKNHLKDLEIELNDYVMQFEFINYEYLEMKKNLAKRSVLSTVVAPQDRRFFLQNGFQYYPFEGEYWRDEIGNYQYIGRNFCEDEN